MLLLPHEIRNGREELVPEKASKILKKGNAVTRLTKSTWKSSIRPYQTRYNSFLRYA